MMPTLQVNKLPKRVGLMHRQSANNLLTCTSQVHFTYKSHTQRYQLSIDELTVQILSTCHASNDPWSHIMYRHCLVFTLSALFFHRHCTSPASLPVSAYLFIWDSSQYVILDYRATGVSIPIHEITPTIGDHRPVLEESRPAPSMKIPGSLVNCVTSEMGAIKEPSMRGMRLKGPLLKLTRRRARGGRTQVSNKGQKNAVL